MRYPKPFYDLVAIQRALLVDATNPETTPAARAQVARAFADAEGMKRIIAGKANPKPVDVKPANGEKRQPRASFTEGPGTPETNKLDTPKPSPLQINATPCASDAPTDGVPSQPSDPSTPQAKQ